MAHRNKVKLLKLSFAVATASLGEQLALMPAYTASFQLLFCVACLTGLYFIYKVKTQFNAAVTE